MQGIHVFFHSLFRCLHYFVGVPGSLDGNILVGRTKLLAQLGDVSLVAEHSVEARLGEERLCAVLLLLLLPDHGGCVVEATAPVALDIHVSVEVVRVVVLLEQFLTVGLLEVVELVPVVDDALHSAQACGDGRPGAGPVPEGPGVVTELHLLLGGSVDHGLALQVVLR